jgi:hypothetical protein
MGYTHHWECRANTIAGIRSIDSAALERIANRFGALLRHLQQHSSADVFRICAFDAKAGEFDIDRPAWSGQALMSAATDEDARFLRVPLGTQLLAFQAAGPEQLQHESFVLAATPGRGFCKTDRKPYDLLVMCALLCARRELGDEGIEISSDGAVEWMPAAALMARVFDGMPGGAIPEAARPWTACLPPRIASDVLLHRDSLALTPEDSLEALEARVRSSWLQQPAAARAHPYRGA